MCKIFMKNKKLYEEKIKELLNELIEHEKIKDVRICLSKVLKKIIGNDKEILHKDQNMHRLCYKLKQDNLPVINHIFNDVNIKYNNIEYENKNKINKEEEKEKYSKGGNEYFLEEFKIELEKKHTVFFLDKSSKKLINVKAKKKVSEPKKEENKKENNEDKKNISDNANKEDKSTKNDLNNNNEENKKDSSEKSNDRDNVINTEENKNNKESKKINDENKDKNDGNKSGDNEQAPCGSLSKIFSR